MRLSAPRHCGGRCQRRTTSVLRVEPGVPGAAASRTVFDTGYYNVFVKTTSNNRGFGPTGPLKNNRNVGLTDAWRGAQPLQPRGCLPLRCLRQSRQTARVHIFRTAWRTAAAICGAFLPALRRSPRTRDGAARSQCCQCRPGPGATNGCFSHHDSKIAVAPVHLGWLLCNAPFILRT